MNKDTVFLVAGGDSRQLYTAKKLAEKYTVYIIGTDKSDIDTGNAIKTDYLYEIPMQADCIILPLPVSDDGIFLNTPLSDKKIPLNSLNSVIADNGIITGGRFSKQLQEIFSCPGAYITDYSMREEFSILNAVPTAEAAVLIAMKNTDSVLYKSKILITGFGRISKALVKILKGCGAEITVAARKKEALYWAEIYGCDTIEISSLSRNADKYKFIFNTVPALILTKDFLSGVRPDVFITDLASRPGGVDFEYAKCHNINTVHALSLPGKYFPETAGEIVAHTAENILMERSHHE